MKLIYGALAAAVLCASCSDVRRDPISPERIVLFGNTMVVVSGANQWLLPGAQSRPIVFEARDYAGNPLAGISGMMSVVGGGTLTRNKFVTSTTGRGSFRWTVGTAGPQVTTIGVMMGPSVNVVANIIPPGSVLTAIAGDAQTGDLGTTLADPLRVKLTDPDGNSIGEGLPVRWTAISGGGRASALQSVLDAVGESSVNWSLGWQSEAQTLRVVIPGVDSVDFSASANVTGYSIIVAAGNAQTTTPNTALPTPIKIRVLYNGTPVAGARGTFQTAQGSFSRTTFVTNASGEASAIWTVGAAGAQTASATVGAIGTATINATAQEGTFLTNFTRTPAIVYSRHVTAERILTAGATLNTTTPIGWVTIDLVRNGVTTGNSCTVSGPAAHGRISCSLEVRHALASGKYSLRYRTDSGLTFLAGGIVTIDATNPITIGSFTQSHSTVRLSDSNTWTITAGATYASSQGLHQAYIEIYNSTTGQRLNYYSPSCFLDQNVADGVLSETRTCSLSAQGDVGNYDLVYYVTDNAGNSSSVRINNAYTVVN